MDPQSADSDEEFVVLSTSDCTEFASYPRAQGGGLKSDFKLFVKSIGFSPSLRRARATGFQASGTARTRIRKYSETMGRQIADHHSVTNYNYFINGGRGGSGGEGSDQGGDGGTGHGPTVYFGQPEAREASAFRTIRLGDLNLVKEFKEMRSSPQWSVVGRQTPRATVRRVYKAKLEGRESGHITVAMYEGDGAEEEWNQDLANYESIRHPNIMQLYGLVRTKKLYAMVYHDELIPYAQFFRRFQHSPILSTYFIGYCNTEFAEATKYLSVVFRKPQTDYCYLPGWIQPRTGQLCVDLTQSGAETSSELYWWAVDVLRLEKVSLDAPDSEDIIISSLSEDQYHELCSQPSIAWVQYFQVSTEHPVGPEVFWSDSQHGTCVRITEPLQILPEKLHWENYGRAPGELLPNSWIRYDFPQMFAFKLESNLWFPLYEIQKAWLAQANHIFAKLEEVTHVEDYVCVYEVEFVLQVAHKHPIPEGYLFVCPPDDFRTNTEPHSHLYKWPACPAYWSLNPSGADRLSTEDARILGFPAIHIETIVKGSSWDHSVYEGLRRFHEGRGFNPDSREIARRLGCPLFEALGDLGSEMPFPAREVYPPWPGYCEQDDPALCRSLGHYL
ncbi:hypothetical protein MSAN_02446000 [Mycena sanguinolenta]|uniref:Protein kinase domain-containing protein n=1 Tax=Mycena sanguinolenta TaxID=230812 RepID=A0A8H6WY24_9AGAR|nr:hypothetical protein MSAN_02446000 [Mycena sanguinolenta]